MKVNRLDSYLSIFSLLGLILLNPAFLLVVSPQKVAEVGQLAPDFSLPDLNGQDHRLADYRGKIVVLEWTNPHCPFVVRHYQDKLMTDLQKKWTSQGVS